MTILRTQASRSVRPPFGPGRNRSRRIVGRSLALVALVLFTYFLIVPLVMLIIGAFRTSPLDPAAEWTLGGFATVLTSPSTLNSIVTSVIYALATTILTVAIALFFAIVNARLTFRLRSFITPMMLIIATIPTLFYVLGWNMLGTPGSGLLGRGLTLIGLEQLLPLVQTSGWAGLIVVSSLKLSAVAYLLLLAAVRRSDQSLEDAAVTAGTSRIRAFFDITGSCDVSVGVWAGLNGRTPFSRIGFWTVKEQEPVNGERRAECQSMVGVARGREDGDRGCRVRRRRAGADRAGEATEIGSWPVRGVWASLPGV